MHFYLFLIEFMSYLLIRLLFASHHPEAVVTGVLEDVDPADGLSAGTGR